MTPSHPLQAKARELFSSLKTPVPWWNKSTAPPTLQYPLGWGEEAEKHNMEIIEAALQGVWDEAYCMGIRWCGERIEKKSKELKGGRS